MNQLSLQQERTKESFENWKEGISKISSVETVWIKVAGLGMAEWAWTTETIRPWVEHCVESFGVDRTIWGSNWPVDKLFGMYESVIFSYKKIWENFTDSEKDKLFKYNAERLFDF